jgi:hypothetical protein
VPLTDSESVIVKEYDWKIGHFVDDYGDAKNSHYIYQTFNGNIAWNTSNGENTLKATFVIEKDLVHLFKYISIKMTDNNDYPLVGELASNSWLKIKNEHGEEIEMDIFGDNGSYQISENKKVLEFLKGCTSLKVAGLLCTKGERYARIRFDIANNHGLQEIIDSIYSMEKIDTIEALQKEKEIEASYKEWSRKRK